MKKQRKPLMKMLIRKGKRLQTISRSLQISRPVILIMKSKRLRREFRELKSKCKRLANRKKK